MGGDPSTRIVELLGALRGELLGHPPSDRSGKGSVGRSIVDLDGAGRREFLGALVTSWPEFEAGLAALAEERCGWAYRYVLDVVEQLLLRALPWTPEELERLLRWNLSSDRWSRLTMESLLRQLESLREPERAHDGLRDAVAASRDRQVEAPGHRYLADMKVIARFDEWLGFELSPLLLEGTAPFDALLAELEALPMEQQRRWHELLRYVRDAGASGARRRFAVDVASHVEAIGRAETLVRLVRWIEELGRAAVDFSCWPEPHVLLATGLLRLTCVVGIDGSGVVDGELVRTVGRVARASFRKVPGRGACAIALGNAAIGVLGALPGAAALGVLARLAIQLRNGSASRAIAKALDEAAVRAGVAREEIDELGVPEEGLDEVGRGVVVLGDCEVVTKVEGPGDVTVAFLAKSGRLAGRPSPTAPAALRKEHGAAVKELKAAAKELAALVTAQRDRLDTLFLEQREWSLDRWRACYLDHRVVGVLARRLIWSFTSKAAGGVEEPATATWLESAGGLVDASGTRFVPPADAVVKLWHPIEAALAVADGWRRFFEERGGRQPFKQAHREVYHLTDAERVTRSYSNRFAAHILRQHQFHALCGVRGWKNSLRLFVDSPFPPATRQLPKWGVRAEFWVDRFGDDPGNDCTSAGAYLRVVTDQVRFYAAAAPQVRTHGIGRGFSGGAEAAEPLALVEIPPLVLSEVLRDVDLFVGVASLGADAQWRDRGGAANTAPELDAYWERASFGELSTMGQGRRDLLARLLPRLAIAAACSLDDRWLVVRGRKRTYRIHLGSGNVVMEPDQSYLCIVADLTAAVAEEKPLLPFEGDRTFELILSKAFLLAADDAIRDPTILRQIERS